MINIIGSIIGASIYGALGGDTGGLDFEFLDGTNVDFLDATNFEFLEQV